jgi:hypothetical protein
MDNSVSADIEGPQVKFFPPLHEQRRSWALEILRRERVTSVRSLDYEITAASRLTIILTGIGRRLWGGYPPPTPHACPTLARIHVLNPRPCHF